MFSHPRVALVAAAAFCFPSGFTRGVERPNAGEDLLVRMQRVFAPAEVPPPLRTPAAGPAKCATALVREFGERREELPDATVQRIESYLSARSAAFDYETAHFRLVYDIVGADAVPSQDISPANGIPDRIERVASWAEFAWSVHVDTRGFAAPAAAAPGAKMEIAFREMNAYGYTERAGDGTRLVLHRNFEGFPANDDPEGSAHGAAKVTVAHELMHAIQWTMSGWTEGAWLEADATYAEDVVFDATNDYVRYLNGPSPVGDPARWAWTGEGYEDCLWQHCIAESEGDAVVLDFFRRRATHRTESPAQSFDEALRLHGSDLATAAARLGVWSHFCGAQASGRPEGFEEAGDFPTPPIHAHLGAVPSNASIAAPGLGSRVLLATVPLAAGRPQLFVTGTAGRPLAAFAITLDRSGARRVRPIAMFGGLSEVVEIADEWVNLVSLTVVVATLDGSPHDASADIALDDDLSVGVLDPGAGARLELLPNRPNPFASATTITFSLPREGAARVVVYDLAGRRVRTLLDDDAAAAGRHEAVWNGLDDRGVPVAPGVYAVRLTGDGADATRKIHLVR